MGLRHPSMMALAVTLGTCIAACSPDETGEDMVCRGEAVHCPDIPEKDGCEHQGGCSWAPACLGDTLQCEDLDGSPGCATQLGCSATIGCLGSEVRCIDQLSGDTCVMLGCRWYVACDIDGPYCREYCGCYFEGCDGDEAPMGCGALDELACGHSSGCQWGIGCDDSGEGGALDCESIPDVASCATQVGCTWDPGRCTGVATPCFALPGSNCGSQQGCSRVSYGSP